MRIVAPLMMGVVCLLPVACGDDGTGPGVSLPASLVRVEGQDQTGTVGAVLGDSLVVRVTDRRGNAVAGVSVAWSVAEGAGSVSAARVTTSTAGRAAVAWTLGTVAGAQTASASVANLAPVTFDAIAEADRPAVVAFTPDSLLFDAVGDTLRLAAAVADRFGNALEGVTLVWSSSDTLVSTVDATGLVTSRGAGQATIGVEADTAHGSAGVRVDPTVASIELSVGADTLNALGDTIQIGATVRDPNGAVIVNPAVAWSSLEPAVATVDGAGRVASQSRGSARIVAVSGTKADTATVLVRQVPATIGIGPDSAAVVAGFTRAYTASAADSNGVRITDPAAMGGVAWSVLDAAVADTAATATSDSTATATVQGVAAGATRLVASLGALADTAAVQVVADPVQTVQTGLSIDRVAESITVGPSGRRYWIELVNPDSGKAAIRVRDPNGAPPWTTSETFGECSIGPPTCSISVDASENLYVPTLRGVVSVDGADGTIRWTSADTFDVRGNVAVASSGVVVAAGRAGKLVALNVADGTVAWQRVVASGTDVLSSPVLDESRDRVYFGTGGFFDASRAFHAAKLSNGDAAWSVAVPGYFTAPAAIAADGTVYVGTSGGGTAELLAFDPAGSIRWRYDPGNAVGGHLTGSPLVDAAGIVYVTSYCNKTVHALSPLGVLLWQVTIPNGGCLQGGDEDGFFASPALDADGVLYIPSFRPTGDTEGLHAIKDGAELWVRPGIGSRYGQLLIAPDGTLIVSDVEAGRIFEIGTGGAPVSAPWPMAHRDAVRAARR